MGGRGGSGRSSAAVIQVPAVDANALADLDIIDAFQDVVNITNAARFDVGNPVVTMQRMRTALATRGWDRDRQDQQLRRFVQEGKGSAMGEPDKRLLTESFKQSGLRIDRRDTYSFTILEKVYRST